MGLIDSIRQAEEKARHAYDRAATIAEDAERRIRQKMRIYPRPSEPAPAAPVEGEENSSPAVQEPIVSVSGKDVSPAELSPTPAPASEPPKPRERRRRNAA